MQCPLVTETVPPTGRTDAWEAPSRASWGSGHRHKVVSCFSITAFPPLPSRRWPLTSWLGLWRCGHCRNWSHFHAPDPVLSIFNPPPAPLRARLLHLVTPRAGGACLPRGTAPPLPAATLSMVHGCPPWGRGLAAHPGAVHTCLQVMPSLSPSRLPHWLSAWVRGAGVCFDPLPPLLATQEGP